jgi:hypothetical protein
MENLINLFLMCSKTVTIGPANTAIFPSNISAVIFKEIIITFFVDVARNHDIAFPPSKFLLYP